MDYYQLLVKGPGDEWTRKQFNHLIESVVTWLEKKRLIEEAEIADAVEVMEDLINVSFPAAKKQRDQILAKAEGEKERSIKALWGIREAVLEGVQARRYAGYRRQIYSQVSRWVLILESQGLLVSTTPMKRTEPLRSILRLMRVGRSNEEIAEQLNGNGSRQIGGGPWTPRDVSGLITRYGSPKKRIGLAKWRDGWQTRIPEGYPETLLQNLPMIPAYRGNGERKRKQPKIFHYRILKSFILTVVESYGAALTLAEIAESVESCISPQLFHLGKETAWPEAGFRAEKKEHRVKFSPRDHLDCSTPSFEEEVHIKNINEKLTPMLTDQELFVFNGLGKGKSKRELARICGCAPGTIEMTRLSLEAKAAHLDPVVCARARQLRAKEGKRPERAFEDERPKNLGASKGESHHSR